LKIKRIEQNSDGKQQKHRTNARPIKRLEFTTTMVGYATSAQALELLAEDWKENYHKNALVCNQEARKEGLKIVLQGAVAALNVDAISQNLPWWMNAVSCLGASLMTGFAIEKYQYRTQLLAAARDLEQIAADWSNRETKHPLRFVSEPEPHVTRYIPESAQRHAIPIKPYTTYEQLLEGTNPNELGLVNGIPGQLAGTVEITIGDSISYQAPLENAPREIIETLDDFMDQFGRILPIGHRVGEDFCPHDIRPAITIDTYYNNRQQERKAAPEAAPGLLWTPAPAHS